MESSRPDKSTHHLIIDHGRELIRLKTRAGAGEESKNKKLGAPFVGPFAEHAGLEIHDAPNDNPWTEVVDIEHRGFWMTTKGKMGVWRAKTGIDMMILLDDGNKNVIIKNGEDGAKGLANFKVEKGGLASQIDKFFSKEELAAIKTKLAGEDGDMIFLVADKDRIAYEAMASLRKLLGKRLGLIDEKRFEFLWVTDFPLFKYNDEEKRWESEHHPFTSVHPDDVKLLEEGKSLEHIRSRSYDLVINGTEIGSGSIRIHERKVQELIFKTIGISDEQARLRFGFLLDAFRYGAPPHGGVAFGLDRLMTFLVGCESIRDVIAFPKTQKAFCPMTNAPSDVDTKQLDELGIKIKKEVV